MSEPITSIEDVRRRVLDLVQAGLDHAEAVHCVAVALHMSVERVEEIIEEQTA